MFQRSRLRAQTQTMFLLDIILDSKQPNQICFNLMGTTDNIYQVVFERGETKLGPANLNLDNAQLEDEEDDDLSDDYESSDARAKRMAQKYKRPHYFFWTCSCPHQSRCCKHIYFIIDKKLGLSSLINQDGDFVNSNSTSHANLWDTVVASLKRTGISKSNTTDQKAHKVVQRPYVGDICGICLEDMTDKCQVVFCTLTCGKSIHSACFEQWKKFKKSCVYCNQE